MPLGSLPRWGSKLASWAQKDPGSLIGGAAGAAIGAGTADEDDSSLLRGIGGALLGGVVGPQAKRTLFPRGIRGDVEAQARSMDEHGQLGLPDMPGQPETGLRDLTSRIRNWTYFSFLSSPDTIMRASFGALGGAMSAGTQRMAEGVGEMLAQGGDFSAGLKKIKEGQTVLRSILDTDNVKDYFKYMNPANAGELEQEYRKYFPSRLFDQSQIAQHGLDQQGRVSSSLGKFYAVPDMLAVRAMMKAGFDPEEAARYTLSGTPSSQWGQWLGDIRQKAQGFGPGAAFLADQTMPFARVGILGLEKGLERLPGVGFLVGGGKRGAPLAGKTFGGRALDAPAADLGAGRDWIGDIVKQSQGGLAGLAGYHAEGELDPRLTAVMGPLAGPAYLPFQLGTMLRERRERGESLGDLTTYARAAGDTVRELSPLGAQPLSLFYRPHTEIARRLVPGAVSDVAEMMDPAARRETRPGEVRAAVERGAIDPLAGVPGIPGDSPTAIAFRSRMPWLREGLPERAAQVDIFGEPRFEGDAYLPVLSELGIDPSENALLRGLSRVAFPSRDQMAPPAMDALNPEMRIFDELGITPTSPSDRVAVPGLGLPLEQTPESAAAVQAQRGLARRVAADQLRTLFTQDPRLRDMPDGPQKQMIAQKIYETIMRQVNAQQQALMLPLSLAKGASLPPWVQTALQSAAPVPDTPAT